MRSRCLPAACACPGCVTRSPTHSPSTHPVTHACRSSAPLEMAFGCVGLLDSTLVWSEAPSSSSVPLAAIIVPCVVIGLLLLGAVAGAVVWHRCACDRMPGAGVVVGFAGRLAEDVSERGCILPPAKRGTRSCHQ